MPQEVVGPFLVHYWEIAQIHFHERQAGIAAAGYRSTFAFSLHTLAIHCHAGKARRLNSKEDAGDLIGLASRAT